MWIPLTAETLVSQYRMKDHSVKAEYTRTADCQTTSIQVNASITTGVAGYRSSDDSRIASITISMLDFCDPNVRIQRLFYGETSSFTLDLDVSLRDARLYASAFPIYELLPDGTGGTTKNKPMPYYLDMRWTSNDPVERTAGAITTSGPGYKSISTLVGFYRVADVSGTLSDGSKNILPLPGIGVYTNFQMFKLRSGEIALFAE
jgi:hypothetical protein